MEEIKLDNAHNVLLKKVLIRLGKIPKLVRAWQNETGVAKSFDGQRTIRYGLNGSADISGILIGGRRLEIEIKTGMARQSKQQKNFQKMIEEMGGVYLLIRKEDVVIDEIKKALLGTRP